MSAWTNPFTHAADTAPTRAVALLRLLGRLEFVPYRAITRLVCPDWSQSWPRTWLAHLHQQRLIWHAPVAASDLPQTRTARNRQPPPCAPLLYGLTLEGRDALATLACEADPQVLETMVIRDWADPEIKRGQLRHDLLVVDWLCSMLDEVRWCRHLAGVRCQLEYVSATDEHGHPRQRFDALAMLWFDPAAPARLHPWQIPWVTAERASSIPDRVLAIEVDRGTERLATLLGKAVMYRDLSLSGHYQRTLGAPVLPVVLCPPGRRAAQIAREWVDGWPAGAGVISSFPRAYHPHYGALWGTYWTMHARPCQVDLLADAGWTLERWLAQRSPREA